MHFLSIWSIILLDRAAGVAGSRIFNLRVSCTLVLQLLIVLVLSRFFLSNGKTRHGQSPRTLHGELGGGLNKVSCTLSDIVGGMAAGLLSSMIINKNKELLEKLVALLLSMWSLIETNIISVISRSGHSKIIETS